MHSTSQKQVTNKKRLGRGLGSLLSTGADEFDNVPTRPSMPPVKESLKENIEKKETLEATVEAVEKVLSAPVPAQPPVEVALVLEKPNNINNIDSSMRIWSLAIEKVFPNPSQPRKDFLKEPLDELSQSIREQGVLQPITVRKSGEKYEIIAGERRWRASQLAGLQEIPAIIKDVDNQKSMELALIENLQRENLNSIEEALGYQSLIEEYDLSQQDVAKKVGKSRTAVTNALRVLALPRDVREMLRQGLISFGHAKVLLAVDDGKAQVNLAKKVLAKQLSVRALEKEILKVKGGSTGNFSTEESIYDRQAQKVGEELQKALGTKVDITYNKGKGTVSIAFYSDEELSNLSEKIKNGCIIGL